MAKARLVRARVRARLGLGLGFGFGFGFGTWGRLRMRGKIRMRGRGVVGVALTLSLTAAKAHRSVGSTQMPSRPPKQGSRNWPRGAPFRMSTCTRLPPSSATSSCSPHSATPRGSMNCPGASPYLRRGRRHHSLLSMLRGGGGGGGRAAASDMHAAGGASELAAGVLRGRVGAARAWRQPAPPVAWPALAARSRGEISRLNQCGGALRWPCKRCHRA
jgi:hypothetical protein